MSAYETATSLHCGRRGLKPHRNAPTTPVRLGSAGPPRPESRGRGPKQKTRRRGGDRRVLEKEGRFD